VDYTAPVLPPVAGLYSKPQYFDYAHARKEFEVCCFPAIRDLLNKTGAKQGSHISGKCRALACGLVASPGEMTWEGQSHGVSS